MPVIAKPLSLAGANVLLAYLLSEMLPSALEFVGIDHWYAGLAQHNLASAIGRSVGCGLLILSLSIALNRAGFRLKL